MALLWRTLWWSDYTSRNFFLQNPDKCAALPDEVLNKRLLPAICQVFFQIN